MYLAFPSQHQKQVGGVSPRVPATRHATSYVKDVPEWVRTYWFLVWTGFLVGMGLYASPKTG